MLKNKHPCVPWMVKCWGEMRASSLVGAKRSLAVGKILCKDVTSGFNRRKKLTFYYLKIHPISATFSSLLNSVFKLGSTLPHTKLFHYSVTETDWNVRDKHKHSPLAPEPEERAHGKSRHPRYMLSLSSIYSAVHKICTCTILVRIAVLWSTPSLNNMRYVWGSECSGSNTLRPPTIHLTGCLAHSFGQKQHGKASFLSLWAAE